AIAPCAVIAALARLIDSCSSASRWAPERNSIEALACAPASALACGCFGGAVAALAASAREAGLARAAPAWAARFDAAVGFAPARLRRGAASAPATGESVIQVSSSWRHRPVGRTGLFSHAIMT